MSNAKTKSDIAYDYLLTMVKSSRYMPGDRLPTEIELGETLKINRLTIAKALAQLKSEGYIERVAGRGTTLIRKPATGPSGLILVVSPWPEWETSGNWYFSRMLYAIHAEAIICNRSIVSASFHANEANETDFERIRNLHHAAACNGAIVFDPVIASHDRLRALLQELSLPSVWADSSLQTYKDDHRVDIDNFQAAYDLTGKLIADGARQIIFMSGKLDTAARLRRFEGYKHALEQNGLTFDERFVICHNTTAYLSDAGSECAGIYAARRMEADAIFLNDYNMSEGIRSFCQAYPNPTNEKLSSLPIATFDYNGQGKQPNIRYSAIQPIEEIGKQAVQTLIEAENRKPDKPLIRILPAEIRSY
jgi:LacI family transcriptional regulator